MKKECMQDNVITLIDLFVNLTLFNSTTEKGKTFTYIILYLIVSSDLGSEKYGALSACLVPLAQRSVLKQHHFILTWKNSHIPLLLI